MNNCVVAGPPSLEGSSGPSKRCTVQRVTTFGLSQDNADAETHPTPSHLTIV